MITEPFIFKVLDINSAHMTKGDNQKLSPYHYSGRRLPAYELSEYGWLVYVGEIEDNWSREMSDSFMHILKEAKELGCDYVRFDRDGRIYEEFPTFDW